MNSVMIRLYLALILGTIGICILISPDVRAAQAKVIIDSNNPNRIDSNVTFNKFSEQNGRKTFNYSNSHSGGAAWICAAIDVRRSNGQPMPIDKFSQPAFNVIFNVTVQNFCVQKIQITSRDGDLDENGDIPKYAVHIEPRGAKVDQGKAITFTITETATTPDKGTVPAAGRKVFFLATGGQYGSDVLLNTEVTTDANGVAKVPLTFARAEITKIKVEPTPLNTDDAFSDSNVKDEVSVNVTPSFQQVTILTLFVLLMLTFIVWWFWRLSRPHRPTTAAYQDIQGLDTPQTARSSLGYVIAGLVRMFQPYVFWISLVSWITSGLLLLIVRFHTPGPADIGFILFAPLFAALPYIAIVDVAFLLIYVVQSRPKGLRLAGAILVVVPLSAYMYFALTVWPQQQYSHDNLSGAEAASLIKECKFSVINAPADSQAPLGNDSKIEFWIEDSSGNTTDIWHTGVANTAAVKQAMSEVQGKCKIHSGRPL